MTVQRTRAQATIANGASLSGAVDLQGYDLIAVEFPAAWTAANVTFQTSQDGVTYRDVHGPTGTEATVTGAANRHAALDSTLVGLFGRYIKVRSGTSGAPVNQAADRVVGVIGRAPV